MNISQRQLRMFTAVAQEMNFSRASATLNISQPALTRAIREFEAQLGVLLFQRTTRRLTLSEEGRRLLPVAQRLIDDMRQAVAELRAPAAGLGGTVTIATGTAFGCTVLPRVLLEYTRRHPQVRVVLRDDNSEGITARVARAEVDFGIGSIIRADVVLTAVKLLDAPLGILAHPGHFALPRRASPPCLARLPLLKEADDTSIMQLLRQHGAGIVAAMERGVEVSNLATQLALAAAGVGVAVLSALGASHADARHLAFVPLAPAIRREVFLMHRFDRPLRPAARALWDLILTELPRAPLHERVTVAAQPNAEPQSVTSTSRSTPAAKQAAPRSSGNRR
ncbi:LysR family transcriptional regulator [Xanthobacteraceae bacterium Astr-EGSB]|uniref:LysR family transcriptional regulator n=1 Tax=Astrobacterium formosum TaxID=3069710 RepID=UPI0027ADF98B|nr:LysR family transcriptional regulator [Xanthobacteraceae bacterium Astr-EGSB]